MAVSCELEPIPAREATYTPAREQFVLNKALDVARISDPHSHQARGGAGELWHWQLFEELALVDRLVDPLSLGGVGVPGRVEKNQSVAAW